MHKILVVISIIFTTSLCFAYEDYYDKVYIVKVGVEDLFSIINATDSQQQKLTTIFKKYRDRATSIEKQFKLFEEKKKKIATIEEERIIDISKVLNESQMKKFIQYTNEKKLEFRDKNDKVMDMMDTLDLENIQEYEILKADRKFKRDMRKFLRTNVTEKEFLNKYDELLEERNETIKQSLSKEQIKLIENFQK